MAVKPKKLKRGSNVGIIAPASPCYNPDDLYEGIRNIRKLGFNVIPGETVHKRKGYLAGDDLERAEEINNFFGRSDIDGIICLRGGYGSLRILDKIDYNLIRDNPKVFIGYSDITAIHLAINKNCDIVTFHGPMVYPDFSEPMDNYTRDSFMKNVASLALSGPIYNPPGCDGIQVLSPGEASGTIIGGNLSTIVSAIGSPYEIDTRGKILFMEDVGEEPYRIDRMLTQLILCGKLHECAGIVLGQWTACKSKDPERSISLMDVFINRLLTLRVPVLYNLASGHGKRKITIPLGVGAGITRDGKLVILEKGVI